MPGNEKTTQESNDEKASRNGGDDEKTPRDHGGDDEKAPRDRGDGGEKAPRDRGNGGDDAPRKGDDQDAPREKQERRAAGDQDGRVSAAVAAAAGIRNLRELISKQPEGVIAVERTGDGWRVSVEVLEDERVPSSADILAIYEADLDPEGELLSYRRTRRYPRGRADDRGEY